MENNRSAGVPGSSGTEECRTIPLVEDVLHVDKRVVDRGGVRVSKRVETHEHVVDELLQTERVEIERRPVNKTLTDDTVPEVRREGDTLIVPVIEEVLITSKRLVLVEEVRVTRVRETHRRPQIVALRKEHIDVERLVPEQPSDDGSSQPPTPQGEASNALEGASEE